MNTNSKSTIMYVFLPKKAKWKRKLLRTSCLLFKMISNNSTFSSSQKVIYLLRSKNKTSPSIKSLISLPNRPSMSGAVSANSSKFSNINKTHPISTITSLQIMKSLTIRQTFIMKSSSRPSKYGNKSKISFKSTKTNDFPFLFT